MQYTLRVRVSEEEFAAIETIVSRNNYQDGTIASRAEIEAWASQIVTGKRKAQKIDDPSPSAAPKPEKAGKTTGV